jgi:L-threonylcarbamoyladenylate synthase
MKQVTKDQFWKRYLGKARKGAVFIYPTDTVYGIGCDATNRRAVDRVRKIKGTNHPFSVIAPNKRWIRQNCIVPKNAGRWMDKLPGPYTLILQMKNSSVAANVSFSAALGVRIPKYWTKDIAAKLGVPIVTTSANRSGSPPVTSFQDTKRFKADFFIDDGIIDGTPSTIVDLTGKKPIIRRR